MDAKLHWANEDSFECETCGKEFRSEHAANQHMDALDHWAATDDQDEYLCETCEKPFTSQNAVEQHMTALGHWTPTIP
jgi:DNA-directed RNA polymerase subunit RPC12/RpoP